MVLSKAIKETFKNRETELPKNIPNALTAKYYDDPQKQQQWQAFLKKNRLDNELTLYEVGQKIKEFLFDKPIWFLLTDTKEGENGLG